MPIQQVISGAACRLLVNNQPMGTITAISYRRSQGFRPIYGIDDPLPQEIAITGRYMVEGRIQGLRTRFGRGFDGAGIVNASSIADYFNQKLCVIELYDRASGQLIGRIEKVLFHSDTVTVSARGVINIDASFIGTFLVTGLTPGES